MPLQLPPGPRDLLFGIGLARQMRDDLLGFYTNLHQTYGDVVYMRLGQYHDFTVFHPDQIKEVLVTKAKSFIRMERPMRVLRQWNGEGLLITEGETWLRHRRLVQPAFNAKRFAAYANAMTTAASRLFDGWVAGRQPVEVDFVRAMTDVTMDIIARTLFGADLGASSADLGRAVAILSEVAVREMLSPITLPDWLPFRRQREKRWSIQTLDATVRSFIKSRRATGEDKGDLLSMLLLAVDDEGDGKGLTDEQARDQCMTLFLAGHDTTAAGLIWVGWVLARHPDIAGRLASEVDVVLGRRLPTYADLPALSYTERVVKETLRHYPPATATFGRKALEEVTIGGWTIPRGGIVRALTYVTHHDPRWFPDPERIDPERFSPGRLEQLPPLAFVPFGAGPRVCIGQNFAMMEMVLLTAMLAQRVTLAAAPGQGEPVLAAQMSLRPRDGLRLTLTPRR